MRSPRRLHRTRSAGALTNDPSDSLPRRLLTPRNEYNARMVAEAAQQRAARRATADELTAEAQHLGLDY